MRRTPLERQLARSRARMSKLRRQAEREPSSALSAAVEELGHTLEEFSVALEQLEVANEELADARHTAVRHALRYRELFQSAPDAYLVTDDRGVIREANEAAAAKFAREARYLTGKPMLVLVAEGQQEGFARQLLAIQRRRRVKPWEASFAPRGGERFWAAVSAKATRGTDGTVGEIRWLLRDVTSQRQAEEALRASEARLRLMADSLPVLISYVDRDQRYRFNNASYERWFGISPDKVYGRHVREVLGDAAYERIRGHVEQALAGRETRFEGQLPYPRGGARSVSMAFVPHVGASGAVLGYYALASDVSELVRMHERLRAAAASVALAEDRERRRLAEDLHDDLGQLLALAGMKLASLRDSAGGEPVETELRGIEDLVKRAHAHTESLTFQLSPPILHDRGFTPAAEWLVEDLGRSYGLQVELEDDGQPKPLDEPARIALFRTLRELLINVARHAQTLEAQVRIWRDGDRVQVEVRDHGLGFEPSHPQGGYGLVAAGERLRALGGELAIHSARGAGTFVVVEVPITAGEARSGAGSGRS